MDFELVPDSVDILSPTHFNTEPTIKGDHTRLGSQETHKDLDDVRPNSRGEIPTRNKLSKLDINASKPTETHTNHNLHSRTETTSSPSPSNPAQKRRRSHSLDTSSFLDFTSVAQGMNNHRNENVEVTDIDMSNERTRRTSLPQHTLSQNTRPIPKSEML